MHIMLWTWCLLRVYSAPSVMFQWVYAAMLAYGRVVGSWELTVHACSVPVSIT
jgi:hypothetical protein